MKSFCNSNTLMQNQLHKVLRRAAKPEIEKQIHETFDMFDNSNLETQFIYEMKEN